MSNKNKTCKTPLKCVNPNLKQNGYCPLQLGQEVVETVMLTIYSVQCSNFVGCVTVSLSEQFCTFKSITMPSSSVHANCWTLKMKALLSFETSQTTHTTMQHHNLSHIAGETSNMTQYCVLVMQGDIHHEHRQTAVGSINGSVCYATTLPTATSYSAGDK
jgi:hypothetical protein